jgi:ribonuclease P protein component
MPTFQGQFSLRGHGAFDKVFGEGKSFFQFPFQFRYLEQPMAYSSPEILPGICLGISVPKKRFKHAVDRNLIRRRVREAFRLNRHLWEESTPEPGMGTAIVLVYSANEILDFHRIQDGLCKAMMRWRRTRLP